MLGKFRRSGGRRGGSKRNSLPLPPPLQRLPSSYSRLSLPSKKPPSTLPSPPPPPQPPSDYDESYSLVSGESLSFASIIRLAPDLVDEIKRVESQGGVVRVKFDSNPNNSSGNIIDVGGKEFRFTWSNEMGGLCDIYEERENDLLAESGCSWRKLNVQRVLDESTKKQVKKRSEEYEQKQKSRKAIVLDQPNPSIKRQMEPGTSVEVGPLKSKSKNKKYLELPQVGGQLKPANPPTIQGTAKENVDGSENIRNVLVTLLKENATGMSLKALKKAVGDLSSYSTQKIEPILKKIATYEHPGRYILKSGIELESLKRSHFDTISSLEDENAEQFVAKDNHGKVPALDTGYTEKSPVKDSVETMQKRDASDRRDGSNVQGRKGKCKRSELSSNENFSLFKYGKEEPKLKESIKSFSQYKDYLKEYREKYESYCSLHKSLETYKNEFQKLGMDLYNAKVRDEERYYDILAQLRESYSQCGMRHKQSKKIFVVLHQQLKHLKQMIKDFATEYMKKSI